MRKTYTKDPGGWNYAQKNNEAGPEVVQDMPIKEREYKERKSTVP